jgi:hypothetical protein
MKSRAVLIGTALAVGLGAAIVESTRDDLLSALGAFVAGVLAVAVAGFALSLPGIHWRGLVAGGFFVSAGILSWTFTDRPLVVWSVLLIEGAIFIVWAWPWLENLRASLRLGTSWLGVSYWILGVVGAVLMVQAEVAVERLAYAGMFGLAVVAIVSIVRRTGQDLSIGVAAAFLLAIAVLLLVGSGNLFEAKHAVPDNNWGRGFNYRFWGGEWLLYHPNSLAGIAGMVAIRIGPDSRFRAWQRLAAVVLAGYIVFITNSRTGFMFLGAAGAVHAALLWWRHRRRPVAELPEYGSRQRSLVAAATPFVVLALVLGVSGGQGFIFQERYGSGGMTSGRLDTWKHVVNEWRSDPIAEKLFGDTATTRAVVIRESSGDIQLTTDNAAVGALRRGGVLGAIAFLFGLGLLLLHALRRREMPAWFIVAVLASIPTIATTDWLLGGTGGTLWILLIAGEALILRNIDGEVRPEQHLATKIPDVVEAESV